MTLVSRRFRRCYLGANKLGLKQVMKKRMIGQGELNMLEAVVILCSKYQNQRLHYEAGAPPGCMAHLLRQCMTMKTSFTMCGIYGKRSVMLTETSSGSVLAGRWFRVFTEGFKT